MAKKNSGAPNRAAKKVDPAAAGARATQPRHVRSANPGTDLIGLDEAIAKAQHGRVNISPAKAVEMAGRLYSQRKFAQAERVCRQIIAARPANGDAHNILGVSIAGLGRLDEGIEELQRAVKINGQAASYRANLGEILRQAGRLEEAAEQVQKAIELEPRNAQALNNLGIIQYERKQFKDAVDSYRSALEIKPDMAEALNNLGNALRLTGDLDGAINAYQEALTLRAVYPEVYNNLGTLLQQDRQFP